MCKRNCDVTVEDVNDNVPKFDQPSYTVSVSEDSPIGSTVTTVSATDAGSGTNGEITYSIIAGNEDVTFSMDPTSGTIVVAHNLDNKADTSFTLTVQAVNGEAVGTNTSVIITVEEVNADSSSPSSVSPLSLRCLFIPTSLLLFSSMWR